MARCPSHGVRFYFHDVFHDIGEELLRRFTKLLPFRILSLLSWRKALTSSLFLRACQGPRSRRGGLGSRAFACRIFGGTRIFVGRRGRCSYCSWMVDAPGTLRRNEFHESGNDVYFFAHHTVMRLPLDVMVVLDFVLCARCCGLMHDVCYLFVPVCWELLTQQPRKFC